MAVPNVLSLFLADSALVDAPLSPEREAALVETYRAGGEDAEQARQELIQRNLRLVISIAKRYQGNGVPLEDLIQEGVIGLITALDRYDPARAKLSTYATWWIRHAVGRAIDYQSRPIRVPNHSYLHLRRIRQATAALRQRLGHDPTLDELSEATGLDAEWIAHLQTITATTSLDLEDEEGDCIYQIADEGPEIEDQVAWRELWDMIVAAVDAIPDPRLRQVVRQRYGLDDSNGRTGREIGRAFGVTRARINQLAKDALEELQYLIPASWLEAYFGCDCTDLQLISFYP
jgi:RNA polymerase primary sigma factor